MIKKIEDYVKELRNTSREELTKKVENIFLDLFAEVEEIKQAKYSGKKSAMLLIFHEQNNKWNAIAERTNIGLIKNGFMNLVKKNIPDIEKLETALAKRNGEVPDD